VADYLAATLDDDRIDRRARCGALDRGDIAGLRHPVTHERLVAECKNVKQFAVPAWLREAATEAQNDGAALGVVIAKRHGVGDPAQQLVIMTLASFVALIRPAA
jgi:hypothetical protein